MSHWTSGLPKLDIEPFDPTPLWDAAKVTSAEIQETERRRKRVVVPLVALGIALVVTAVAMTVMAVAG